MPERIESESRKLLGRLRNALAESSEGQARLDRVVELIASSMRTEVCSIYLFRDAETLGTLRHRRPASRSGAPNAAAAGRRAGRAHCTRTARHQHR